MVVSRGDSNPPTACMGQPTAPPTLWLTLPPKPIRSRAQDLSSPKATGHLERCYLNKSYLSCSISSLSGVTLAGCTRIASSCAMNWLSTAYSLNGKGVWAPISSTINSMVFFGIPDLHLVEVSQRRVA